MAVRQFHLILRLPKRSTLLLLPLCHLLNSLDLFGDAIDFQLEHAGDCHEGAAIVTAVVVGSLEDALEVLLLVLALRIVGQVALLRLHCLNGFLVTVQLLFSEVGTEVG